MSPAAEIIFFPVKPDVDVLKLMTEGAQVAACQRGFKAAYLGPLIKDQKVYCFALEWEDRAALETWTREHDAQAAKKTYDAVVDLEAGLEPFISK